MDNAAGQITRIDQTGSVPFERHGWLVAPNSWMLIVVLWLTTHSYVGVLYDSRFYTIQAMVTLLPERFGTDLYFHDGSQDQFTFFTRIYRPFLEMFNIADANIVLCLIGQSIWLGGLIYLAKSLFRDRRVILLAVAAAILIPGGTAIQYGEPILTPRLFAEAISFWALGEMLRSRPISAMLLFCISMPVHPLMTIPGIAILFIYEALKRPAIWIVGAAATAAAFGLAFANVQPFARLLVTFDPLWLSVVQVRNYWCLITHWGFEEWLPVITMLILWVLGYHFSDPTQRRFLLTILGVAVGGIVLSLVGGDVLLNVLIVDAQLWRATWPLGVVANLFVGLVVLRIAEREGSTSEFTVFLTAMTVFVLASSKFFGQVAILAAPLAAATCLVYIWEDTRKRQIPVIARMLFFLFACSVFTLACLVLYLSAIHLQQTPDGFRSTLYRIVISTSALCAIGIYASGGHYLRNPARSIIMACLSIALFCGALVTWDQRSPWTKFVDTTESPPSSLTSLLPDDLPIYWEGDITVPWFLLKRPSYFSCEQGTGVLFSRGTAINYLHRYEAFQKLRTLDFGTYRFCPSSVADANTPLTAGDLTSICATESGLGALVLRKAVTGLSRRVWVSPVKFEYMEKIGGKLRNVMTDRFFVYSCRNLKGTQEREDIGSSE